MTTKILTILTFVLLTNILSSQEVSYYNSKGNQTVLKKASYFETLYALSNGAKLLVKLRMNKDTISMITCSSISPMIREGITKIFFESGIQHYIKTYHDNKLDGKTTRFYENGEIKTIIIFAGDSALIKKSFDKNGNEIDYIFDGTEPKYQNKSIDYFRSFLADNINYPKLAVENNISSSFKVTFSITELGQITDIEAKTDIIPFRNEIINVIKSTNGKWIPGEMYGEPYKVKMTMNLNFNIPK